MPVQTEKSRGPSRAFATSIAGTMKLGISTARPVNERKTDQRFQWTVWTVRESFGAAARAASAGKFMPASVARQAACHGESSADRIDPEAGNFRNPAHF